MAAEKVTKLITSNPVMVFSKSYCPYCNRVKSILSSLKARFQAMELDYESDGSAIQNAITSLYGQRTVPAVFINGQFIGGCDDTDSLNRQGKLMPLLESAGAL